MTSTESTEDFDPDHVHRNPVYLSGEETIYLISDILDPKPKEERATGRTSRLACKYAEMAMQFPNTRVMVKDHYDDKHAHNRLMEMVGRILTTLNIEYQMSQIPIAIKDPNSFTGVKMTDKAGHYIIVRPPFSA